MRILLLLAAPLLLTVTTIAQQAEQSIGAVGTAAGEQIKRELEPTALVNREGCKMIDADKVQADSTWDAPEFGSIEEIKNCTTVYVWATDLDDRKKILKALEKDKSLTVVGNLQEAEFLIVFQIGGYNTGASIIGSTITNNSREVGQLVVVTRGQIDGQGKRHQRIVWSDTETRDFSGGISFSRPPLNNSIGHFLKDLKKARNQK